MDVKFSIKLLVCGDSDHVELKLVLVTGHTFNYQKIRLVIPVSAKLTLYILKDGSPLTIFHSLGGLFRGRVIELG
jgi:hypothetical protein